MPTRWRNVLFYLGLALLFTHELDAMPNHEWRMLPLVRLLAEPAGEALFLLAHVPIFAVTIAFVASLNEKVRQRTATVASAFLALHALLHYLFSGHEAYEFSSPLSSLLIYGAGLCGLAWLLADLRPLRHDAD